MDQSNSGHGRSCVRGYHTAVSWNAEWIFQIDSDGQCDPHYFPSLWDKRNEKRSVYGFRYKRDDGLKRLLISRVLTWFVYAATRGTWVRDPNVPYRLMHVSTMAQRLALINGQCPEIYTGLDIYLLRGIATFNFLRNKNLIDLVESIVGPEITCNPIQHIRGKLPDGTTVAGDGHVAAWHQDAGVMLEEADPHFILTVWLPLVSATPENGCLQIIPRVHNTGLWEHETVQGKGTVITEDYMPDAEPLVLPMEKGDVLLMHKEIPHRSTPNNTDTVRWSMDLRYQITGTPTGRPFYPDFVVRSKANPETILTDHAKWANMWKEALESHATQGAKHHRWEVVPARSE